MTLLSFMRMTTLAQGAINLVAQFVKIVLKIFALYLQDQAKLFLDNMGIKGPKKLITVKNWHLRSDIM